MNPQLRAAEKLMEYLITLGSSSMSESFLIRHVLSQISALADQLWQAFQVISAPPATAVNAKQTSTLFQLVVKRADRLHLSGDSALTQAFVFQRWACCKAFIVMAERDFQPYLTPPP
ncbi:hypothetical protein L3Q82_011413 [Scortum barcoo]|uniref:Uncharacterized protein n=1 Tax=Scortum barcoo TaxID=214431 RepID=A0ACB8WAB4_9TELE|nr:hypothetical protein L3Q82_011413 [Scortum barcoo]